MNGEKEYKRMISKIKEIACEFSDDVEKAHLPPVLRSISKKTGQHLKESISVQHHVQTRYDPYLQVHKGWDDSTEELVTEIFMVEMSAYGILILLQVRLSIARTPMMTDTLLAKLVGKSLPATPTCVGTTNPTMLNFVISAIEFLFQMISCLLI